MYYYQFILVQAGGMRGGKTFSGRTTLLGVAVWMDKLAQRGAKLKLHKEEKSATALAGAARLTCRRDTEGGS
jgi:hypothetical protein